MLVIEIADIVIGVKHSHPYLRELSRDYISDKIPELFVSLDEGDLEREHELFLETYEMASEEEDGALESSALHRKIAKEVLFFDAFVFHGAVIVHDGKAYLFTAESGVGKTTHIRLWLSRFKENTYVLNGDKPLIRIKDGNVLVSGTPWRGKEGYGTSGTLPLAGIAFLERGEKNEAYPIKAEDALIPFARQAYMPRANAADTVKLLRLFDKVLQDVPLIRLKCNMNEEAAEVARIAFLQAEKLKNDNKKL